MTYGTLIVVNKTYLSNESNAFLQGYLLFYLVNELVMKSVQIKPHPVKVVFQALLMKVLKTIFEVKVRQAAKKQ